MERPEYTRLPFKIIAQEIVDAYKLKDTEEGS